MIHIEKDL